MHGSAHWGKSLIYSSIAQPVAIVSTTSKLSAGSANTRPELQKALDFVREEDVFVVTKLDRLARSVVDLSEIVKKLQKKNVDLVVMDQGIDTTTIYGR